MASLKPLGPSATILLRTPTPHITERDESRALADRHNVGHSRGVWSEDQIQWPCRLELWSHFKGFITSMWDLRPHWLVWRVRESYIQYQQPWGSVCESFYMPHKRRPYNFLFTNKLDYMALPCYLVSYWLMLKKKSLIRFYYVYIIINHKKNFLGINLVRQDVYVCEFS